ncbi:uncharacterized protein C8Q71DRAFT_863913, partial [Rhodofomes roseus]
MLVGPWKVRCALSDLFPSSASAHFTGQAVAGPSSTEQEIDRALEDLGEDASEILEMQTAAQEIYLEYSRQMSQAMYGYALLPTLDMFQTECNLVSVHKTFSTRSLDTQNVDALVANFNTSTYQNLLHPHRVEVAIAEEAFDFPANQDWHHPEQLPWVKLKPRELGAGEHSDAPRTHAAYTLIGQHRIEASKQMLQSYVETMAKTDAELAAIGENSPRSKGLRTKREKLYDRLRKHGCWLCVVYKYGSLGDRKAAEWHAQNKSYPSKGETPEEQMRQNMRELYKWRSTGSAKDLLQAHIRLSTIVHNIRPPGTSGSMLQTALTHMYRNPAIRHFLCSLTPILDASLPLYNDGSDPTKTRGFGRHYYDRCALFAVSSWRRVFAKGGGITLFAMMRMQWVMGVIGSKESFHGIKEVEEICDEYDKARVSRDRYLRMKQAPLNASENAAADRKTELAMYAVAHDLDEVDGAISSTVARSADRLQREYTRGAQLPNYELWTDEMLDTVDQFATDHLVDAASLGVRCKQGFSMMNQYSSALINQLRLKAGGALGQEDDDEDLLATEGDPQTPRSKKRAWAKKRVKAHKKHMEHVIGRLAYAYYNWTVLDDAEFTPELPLLTCHAISLVGAQVGMYSRGWERVAHMFEPTAYSPHINSNASAATNTKDKVEADKTLHALMATVNTPYLKTGSVRDFTQSDSVHWALAREFFGDRHTFVALLQDCSGSPPASVSMFRALTRDSLRMTYMPLTQDVPTVVSKAAKFTVKGNGKGKGKAKSEEKARADSSALAQDHDNAVKQFAVSPAGTVFPKLDIRQHVKMFSSNLRCVTDAIAMKTPDLLQDTGISLDTPAMRALMHTTASTAEKKSAAPAAAAGKKGNASAGPVAGFTADIAEADTVEGVGSVTAAAVPKAATRVLVPMVVYLLNEVAIAQLLYNDPGSKWWSKPIGEFREKYRLLMDSFIDRNGSPDAKHAHFQWWDLDKPKPEWDAHPVPQWYVDGEPNPQLLLWKKGLDQMGLVLTKQKNGPGTPWQKGSGAAGGSGGDKPGDTADNAMDVDELADPSSSAPKGKATGKARRTTAA